jgi:beta-xylosidase
MPTELRDEFEKSLDPGWSWLAEDPANWSLTAVPGSLQITAGRGHVKQDTISNLLLRSAPSGNSFEIETKMTFEPTGNFQFAGLLVYESSSSFLQAGRAYCTSAPCVGDGLYFDLTENNIFVPPNHATRIPATDTVYLRLQRDGGSYSFSYSLDGQTWTAAGEHLSNIVPRFIGLVAGQSESGSRPAVFDYFQWTIQSQDA